ncbi:MAG: hypothetical protein WCD38_14145 [Candidatus Tumulicola sp.]
MTTESQPPRARIADIIRDSGRMAGADSSISPDKIAAVASVLTGTPAGVIAASESISDELAARFRKLSASATVERDIEAGYETAGHALVLAMAACGYVLTAAFDTASGAILEAKKPMSLLSTAFTVSIAMVDRGATTHLTVAIQHVGVDWGNLNAKTIEELLMKTAGYLKLFAS